MTEIKQSENIKNFAYEAFENIWSKLTFCSPLFCQQRAENLSKTLSDTYSSKSHHFTENIASAICVTQIFLHDYFKTFFDFNDDKNLDSVLIDDLKYILVRWLRKRNNVFVQVIDTVAVIVEACMYCDRYKNFNLHPTEYIEWFIELFEENFASDFFKKGGWKRLDEKATLWYSHLVKIVDKYVKVGYDWDYKSENHYCAIVSCLRLSKVMFPVSEHWFCEKCRNLNDENITMQIIFAVPDNEILKHLSDKFFYQNTRDIPRKSIDDVRGPLSKKFSQTLVKNEIRLNYSNETVNNFNIPGKNVNSVNYSSDVLKDLTVEVENFIEAVNYLSEFGNNPSNTEKKLGEVTNYPCIDIEKCVEPIKNDDFTKIWNEIVEEFVDPKLESCVTGRNSSKSSPESTEIPYESIDTLQELTISEMDSIDIRVESDTVVYISDSESESSDNGNFSCNQKNGLIQSDEKQEVKDCSNEEVSTHVSAFAGFYLSDSTINMNKKLLEKIISPFCLSKKTENTDFYFLANEYSYSVEVMLKEIIPSPSEKITEFCKLDLTAISSAAKFPSLLKQLLCFNNLYICVCIGGGNYK